MVGEASLIPSGGVAFPPGRNRAEGNAARWLRPEASVNEGHDRGFRAVARWVQRRDLEELVEDLLPSR